MFLRAFIVAPCVQAEHGEILNHQEILSETVVKARSDPLSLVLLKIDELAGHLLMCGRAARQKTEALQNDGAC